MNVELMQQIDCRIAQLYDFGFTAFIPRGFKKK